MCIRDRASTLLFTALKEAIDEEMANDVNVCVMGEDVGQYGGSYKVRIYMQSMEN